MNRQRKNKEGGTHSPASLYGEAKKVDALSQKNCLNVDGDSEDGFTVHRVQTARGMVYEY